MRFDRSTMKTYREFCEMACTYPHPIYALATCAGMKFLHEIGRMRIDGFPQGHHTRSLQGLHDMDRWLTQTFPPKPPADPATIEHQFRAQLKKLETLKHQDDYDRAPHERDLMTMLYLHMEAPVRRRLLGIMNEFGVALKFFYDLGGEVRVCYLTRPHNHTTIYDRLVTEDFPYWCTTDQQKDDFIHWIFFYKWDEYLDVGISLVEVS